MTKIARSNVITNQMDYVTYKTAGESPCSVGKAPRFFCVALGLGLLFGGAYRAGAEETYTAPDGKLTFSYPQRWQAENAGERVRLTAPDGTHYFLLRDTISSLPGDSPAANPEMKTRATELVKPLLKDAVFASAQPLTMDHGLGAVYRFHGPLKADTGPATAIYLGFLGKHSIVLLPEKPGQSSQSIGLAGILQSLAFTDELPKPAPQRAPPRNLSDGRAVTITGPGTVNYISQIAPILKEKCEVCHRSAAPLGGFSVSSYAEVMKGGRHGDLVLAGKPESSSLVDYLTGKRELMPKGGPPLPADQIALIRKWISEGAREQVGGPVATTGGSTTGSTGGVAGVGGAGRANRLRTGLGGAGTLANRTGRAANATSSTGPQLLEGYSGHLIANDLSFTLRLHLDKSASAVWSLSPGREIHYAGTYVGEDGSYVVTLTQSNTPPADQGKTLSVEMRPHGSQETGIFGLDGARPRREISELELSETRAAGKATPSGPIRFGNQANTPTGNQQKNRRRGR
jgi:hypothetical protein